jgi:hypothetical protein
MATVVREKQYQIEILNRSLEKVAEVINPYPINRKGDILRYSNELSYYGYCTFRVATEDPILAALGDVLEPHRYHVRIRRYGYIVWQGAIIDNPSRNKNYIEVKAAQYLFYFDKKRIKRDAVVTAGDGKDNYRLFNTGTMASAVNSIITEMIAGFGSGHVLSNMTIGTIDNPNYPANFTTSTGAALTGAWNFSTDVVMQFDYHSVLHVLRSFGAVSNADFGLSDSLVFSFRSFYGTTRLDMGFTYGTFGNIIDYDVPRYGERMINDYYGLATDDKGTLLRLSEVDTTSVNTYGAMEGSTAFGDVINNNILRARLKEDLGFLSTPESAPVNLTLDDKTFTIGTWSVGDVVNVKIKDHVIDFNAPRRIVGMTVTVHNTGKELAMVQTNRPRDGELGA